MTSGKDSVSVGRNALNRILTFGNTDLFAWARHGYVYYYGFLLLCLHVENCCWGFVIPFRCKTRSRALWYAKSGYPSQTFGKQESIPVGCPPPVCWPERGGSFTAPSLSWNPLSHKPPFTEPLFSWNCSFTASPLQHPRPFHGTPVWTEWLKDRCKNITFPQLRLWAVNMNTYDSCPSGHSHGPT